MGTRNKVIRTCDNCRRRKIKCDRKEPACSACRQRSLICEYKSKRNEVKEGQKTPLRGNNNLHLHPRLNNILDFRDKGQEKELNQTTFRNLKYVSNEGGRVIFYGPTSFRNVIRITSLEAHFVPFWNSFEDTRKRWKEEHQHLSLRRTNTNFTHMPLCLITSGSILEALCTCLPNFDKIVEIVKTFFESEFFTSLPFIDPTKVFQDLNSFLVHDSRITSFNLEKKDNLCKLAIITEILSVVYFQDKVPAAVELFHSIVISSIGPKSLFLEKIQFLMLRYIVCRIEGIIHPDDVSLRNLVNMAHINATAIGLHQTENYHYFRDGPKYLSTLRTFILFADFEVAFSLGSPLSINEGAESILFCQTNTECDKLEDSLSVFARRVLFLREIMVELYERTTESGLETIIYTLKLFYIETFGPILSDIVSGQNTIRDYKVLILKLSTLQVISNLSLISLSLRDEASYELERNTLLCQLLSMKLVIDNLQTRLVSFKTSKKDFLNVGLFTITYSFHSIAPRAAVDLFSVIVRAAIFEKSHHHLRQEKYSHCHDITDFENILKRMDFLREGEMELHLDFSTALDLLETLHHFYLGGASSGFLRISSRSYISKITDVFIPSIKTAIEILLENDETLEKNAEKQSHESTTYTPFFEDLFDFFFDDDLLFQG